MGPCLVPFQDSFTRVATNVDADVILDGEGDAAGLRPLSIGTTPFTAPVVTVIYFDLRVRKEGFHLELLGGSGGR